MASAGKVYAGAQVRQLRDEHGLTQAELARRLELSPSYLNQIERDRRPLTAAVLTRIGDCFDVDPDFFAGEDGARLHAALREVLLDVAADVPPDELTELATRMPRVARALVGLGRRHRATLDAAARAGSGGPGGGPVTAGALMPHEEVRDFFYDRQNHIAALDEAAERLASEIDLTPGDPRRALATHLQEAHGVRIAWLREDGDQRRYDPSARVLALAPGLRPGQQAFQLATQLALLAHERLLTGIAAEGSFTSPHGLALARIGLAHYYAGALLMPYAAFHAAAEELRYDIDRLGERFGTSFEMVCHRLSTLQRPGLRGVPFSFVRVDRAGNISKRQSATGFHFSRTGGSCPLWNVYEAFGAPGRILTQVAAMPDGRRYLWVARTVTSRRRGYRMPTRTFALGLGCEIRHASRLVYSTGLDLEDAGAATPIGMGCKACERLDCPQRAFPPAGHDLDVDEHRAAFSPYGVRGRRPSGGLRTSAHAVATPAKGANTRDLG